MKKALIIVGILLAIVALVAIGKRGSSAASRGVEVQIEDLALRVIRSSILASGKVTYDDKVTLTSEIIGIVKNVHVEQGQVVHKGDLVLEIRDEEYAAAVAQSRATVRVQQTQIERARLNIDLLQRQWERSKQLLERKIIAREAYDKAQLDFDLAKVDLKSADASLSQSRASLEQAEKLFSKTRIFSPIDGVVVSLDLKVGETAIPSAGAIPGSTLMVIADPQSIYTQVNVDEADVGSVGIGNEAQVVAVAFPNSPMQGTLDSMAASAKVAEGRQGLSFAVKIRLHDVGAIKLRSGMTCRAEIYTSSSTQVLAVPIQAIVVEEDRKANKTSHFVFLSRDGVAQKTAVTPGISDDKYQQVTAGLKAGDKLIVGPDKTLQTLKQGTTITIRAAPAAG